MNCQLSTDLRKQLSHTASTIVASGKGILAADESTGTIGKRFTSISIDNSIDNRRSYRELLFTAGGKSIHVPRVAHVDEISSPKDDNMLIA